MKGFSALLLSLIICTISCQPQGVVGKHGLLKVSGEKIINENKEAVSFAGMSFFWSNDGWEGEKFYEESTVDYLVERWNTKIVRAAMAIDKQGGYVENPNGTLAKAEKVIDAAIKNDIYVIVDFHSHHAEDYEEYAHSFFDSISRKYGHSDHIIYEIYNEPLNVSWDTILKPYSERVIKTIRKNDPNNLILVGTPNWSQDVDRVIGNEIEDINVAYVLHFYAATHKDDLRMKAQKAIDNGVPLFVSEWGSIEASGDGEIDEKSVREWMGFLSENKLSHCNWSVCDKDEGASIFKAKSGVHQNYDEWLSESGKFVLNIIKDWEGKNVE